jgi:hypothetical protein
MVEPCARGNWVQSARNYKLDYPIRRSSLKFTLNYFSVQNCQCYYDATGSPRCYYAIGKNRFTPNAQFLLLLDHLEFER